jgi:hypothetical protein
MNGDEGIQELNKTDKERLISFLEKMIPDDFVCARFSLSFKDDNTAILTMDNSHSDFSQF